MMTNKEQLEKEGLLITEFSDDCLKEKRMISKLMK